MSEHSLSLSAAASIYHGSCVILRQRPNRHVLDALNRPRRRSASPISSFLAAAAAASSPTVAGGGAAAQVTAVAAASDDGRTSPGATGTSTPSPLRPRRVAKINPDVVFDLSPTYLGPAGLVPLVPVFQTPWFDLLRALDFSGCGLRDPSAVELAHCLAGRERGARSIVSVVLDKNNFTMAAADDLKRLRRCVHPRAHFSIRNNPSLVARLERWLSDFINEKGDEGGGGATTPRMMTTATTASNSSTTATTTIINFGNSDDRYSSGARLRAELGRTSPDRASASSIAGGGAASSRGGVTMSSHKKSSKAADISPARAPFLPREFWMQRELLERRDQQTAVLAFAVENPGPRWFPLPAVTSSNGWLTFGCLFSMGSFCSEVEREAAVTAVRRANRTLQGHKICIVPVFLPHIDNNNNNNDNNSGSGGDEDHQFLDEHSSSDGGAGRPRQQEQRTAAAATSEEAREAFLRLGVSIVFVFASEHCEPQQRADWDFAEANSIFGRRRTQSSAVVPFVYRRTTPLPRVFRATTTQTRAFRDVADRAETHLATYGATCFAHSYEAAYRTVRADGTISYSVVAPHPRMFTAMISSDILAAAGKLRELALRRVELRSLRCLHRVGLPPGHQLGAARVLLQEILSGFVSLVFLPDDEQQQLEMKVAAREHDTVGSTVVLQCRAVFPRVLANLREALWLACGLSGFNSHNNSISDEGSGGGEGGTSSDEEDAVSVRFAQLLARQLAAASEIRTLVLWDLDCVAPLDGAVGLLVHLARAFKAKSLRVVAFLDSSANQRFVRRALGRHQTNQASAALQSLDQSRVAPAAIDRALAPGLQLDDSVRQNIAQHGSIGLAHVVSQCLAVAEDDAAADAIAQHAAPALSLPPLMSSVLHRLGAAVTKNCNNENENNIKNNNDNNGNNKAAESVSNFISCLWKSGTHEQVGLPLLMLKYGYFASSASSLSASSSSPGAEGDAATAAMPRLATMFVAPEVAPVCDLAIVELLRVFYNVIDWSLLFDCGLWSAPITLATAALERMAAAAASHERHEERQQQHQQQQQLMTMHEAASSLSSRRRGPASSCTTTDDARRLIARIARIDAARFLDAGRHPLTLQFVRVLGRRTLEAPLGVLTPSGLARVAKAQKINVFISYLTELSNTGESDRDEGEEPASGNSNSNGSVAATAPLVSRVESYLALLKKNASLLQRRARHLLTTFVELPDAGNVFFADRERALAARTFEASLIPQSRVPVQLVDLPSAAAPRPTRVQLERQQQRRRLEREPFSSPLHVFDGDSRGGGDNDDEDQGDEEEDEAEDFVAAGGGAASGGALIGSIGGAAGRGARINDNKNNNNNNNNNDHEENKTLLGFVSCECAVFCFVTRSGEERTRTRGSRGGGAAARGAVSVGELGMLLPLSTAPVCLRTHRNLISDVRVLDVGFGGTTSSSSSRQARVGRICVSSCTDGTIVVVLANFTDGSLTPKLSYDAARNVVPVRISAVALGESGGGSLKPPLAIAGVDASLCVCGLTVGDSTAWTVFPAVTRRIVYLRWLREDVMLCSIDCTGSVLVWGSCDSPAPGLVLASVDLHGSPLHVLPHGAAPDEVVIVLPALVLILELGAEMVVVDEMALPAGFLGTVAGGEFPTVCVCSDVHDACVISLQAGHYQEEAESEGAADEHDEGADEEHQEEAEEEDDDSDEHGREQRDARRARRRSTIIRLLRRFAPSRKIDMTGGESGSRSFKFVTKSSGGHDGRPGAIVGLSVSSGDAAGLIVLRDDKHQFHVVCDRVAEQVRTFNNFAFSSSGDNDRAAVIGSDAICFSTGNAICWWKLV